MFKKPLGNKRDAVSAPRTRRSVGFGMEPLEERQFLSASHGGHGTTPGGGISLFAGHGDTVSSIQFSQAPAAVQAGLGTLATNAGLTDPAATQTVYLGNTDGAETYSVVITGTGTTTRLTVDDTGAPVTAHTRSTTTWVTLSGGGTGGDAAAAAEISAIATALGLTAPASTTNVNVATASDGTATYSVTLASAASTSVTGRLRHPGATITVDGNGNPVGNQNLPFSVIPAAIQSALNANRPSGVAPLAGDSTQSVSVRTQDGLTTYTATFAGTGTRTSVTVNKAGVLTSRPNTTATTFGAIPAAAQAELQALAAANGFTGTITADQTVSAYAAGDGETLYTVRLSVPQTNNRGISYTKNLTITVDGSGNPTVLPGEAGGGGGCAVGVPTATSAASPTPASPATAANAARTVRAAARRH